MKHIVITALLGLSLMGCQSIQGFYDPNTGEFRVDFKTGDLNVGFDDPKEKEIEEISNCRVVTLASPNSGFLRLRSLPDSNGHVLMKLRHGAEVEITNSTPQNGFVEVLAPRPSDMTGWVHSHFLKHCY